MDYEKLLNPRLVATQPSGIRRFFDMAASLDNVIALTIGEPDFSTPWHIRQAGIDTLEKGKTWYSPNAGFVELRRAIAAYLKRRFTLQYDPTGEVVVTVGGSEAIDLTMRALVAPGDEVLVPSPSFVCYAPLANLAGGVAVAIETRAADDFRLTAAALKAAITPKTKLLILPYPNNPTGGVMTREQLMEIARVLEETDIVVVSDEIYSELVYGGHEHTAFASISGMRERTITLNGFSKAFAMTGWRVGYACGPRELIAPMFKIHQFTMLCASMQGQVAADRALGRAFETGFEDVRTMVRSYDRRRRLMVENLNDMGLECFEPKGAFYVFPSIKRTGLTSDEFCTRLLMEQKVACVPGTAFGACGEGHIRCSYATSLDNLKEALVRIGDFVASL